MNKIFALVAQLVEHLSEEQRVAGSVPAVCTKLKVDINKNQCKMINIKLHHSVGEAVISSPFKVTSRVRIPYRVPTNNWDVVKLVITRDFDSRILGSSPSVPANLLRYKMVIDLIQVRRVLGVLADNGTRKVHFQFNQPVDRKALTYKLEDDKVPNLRIKAVMYKDVTVLYRIEQQHEDAGTSKRFWIS